MVIRISVVKSLLELNQHDAHQCKLKCSKCREKKMPFGPRPDHPIKRTAGACDDVLRCSINRLLILQKTADTTETCRVWLRYFIRFIMLNIWVLALDQSNSASTFSCSECRANLRYRITGYFNSSDGFGFLLFRSVLSSFVWFPDWVMRDASYSDTKSDPSVSSVLMLFTFCLMTNVMSAIIWR